jgi:hypothetical protein
LVKEAIDCLVRKKNISPYKDTWQLTKKINTEIQDERKKRKNALKELLVRYFPQDIEVDVLEKWFLKASSDFFGFNGEEWVKSLTNSDKVRFEKTKNIRELLAPSIKEYGLSKQEQKLINAFNDFIESEDGDDMEFLMNLN